MVKLHRNVDMGAGCNAGENAGNRPAADRVDALYGRLGVGGQVVMAQLPLTVSLCLVVAAAAVFSPATLAGDMFRMALLAHAAIFAACPAIPWATLPAGASAAIPVLDCLAIGFTREAGGPAFNGPYFCPSSCPRSQ